LRGNIKKGPLEGIYDSLGDGRSRIGGNKGGEGSGGERRLLCLKRNGRGKASPENPSCNLGMEFLTFKMYDSARNEQGEEKH